MSSATQYVMGAGRQTIKTAAGRTIREANTTVARLGISPRQLELNRLWAYYRAQQYDARTTDWDGSPRTGGLELEQITQSGFLPPGFEDPGRRTLPLRFRRPTAPYHLVRLVVNRFTGLLFSEKRHPSARAPGDELTEDWLGGFCEATRYWAQMIQARGHGGAMGSACIGFQFAEGRPIVEVHDPRWLFPEWRDRAELKLRGIEKRYQYPQEEFNQETGVWEEVPYWYRRVIDEHVDAVWRPQPVTEEEPYWGEPVPENPAIDRAVVHDLGFCPVYWIQNLPVQDSIDGDPDCHGAYDTNEEIDALTAQGNRALKANADPTVVVATDAGLDGPLKKGSDNAILVPSTGSVTYLEITGASIEAIDKKCDNLERRFLQMCQCVLERPDGADAKTATEVDRLWSSMLAKADILREQYGQRGIVPLLDGASQAAAKLGQKKISRTETGGKIIHYGVKLPPRVEKLPDGKVKIIPRRLGNVENQPQLQWPRYFDPTLDDAQKAVSTAVSAKAGNVVDLEHAVQLVAPFFDIEDVQAVIASMTKGKQAEQDAEEERAMAKMRKDAGTWEAPDFSADDLNDGMITVNEWRASKGLPAWTNGDGELTVPQFKGKYPELFATATVVGNPATAEQILGMQPPSPSGFGDGGGGNGEQDEPPQG